ncbi:HEAT repeat domain-containing protein [Clavibacter michiganensis]|uniref:HEAT repeat domain-containing protein n=2 Tax=Clavibacter michiganensis TaxID=28447 RepID=UPI0013663228|nr:HEAT repeat domain-containing protein [Clavibacter michiganensis]MDO4039904.1 HEAT repeat domain-containing protein [Clavibacter michiganensis]MDO4060713.1 HEAT repeat domain-containing protein [Clavibacter michiganensis]MDO4077105.1 HEAT repeat domain-containing protein [Clavibacter michiganensis]MDO4092274.1 HEAT repeat domain-containing protein [Clavibacter michiganensis]MDO4101447.1 HEAT repeat domain-containing protein [Clavibacter michiganensis]
MADGDDPRRREDSLATRMSDAVSRTSEREVALRAMGLLDGLYEGDDFLLLVGGRHARGILNGAPPLYWPEAWGARALLYAWTPEAAKVVEKNLTNRAWRVREACAKVVATRQLPLVRALTVLVTDENARVRGAAHDGLEALAARHEQVLSPAGRHAAAAAEASAPAADADDADADDADADADRP